MVLGEAVCFGGTTSKRLATGAYFVGLEKKSLHLFTYIRPLDVQLNIGPKKF